MENKQLKILYVAKELPGWIGGVEKRLQSNVKISWNNREFIELSKLQNELNPYDICMLQGETCLKLQKGLVRRTVGSHFMGYTDFIHVDQGVLWSSSLFTDVMTRLFRKNVRSHDYKGPVIFLGEGALIWPAIQVLAQNGFKDFVILKVNSSSNLMDTVSAATTGLLDTKLSSVDSTAFIRSQKEYSLCFVMEDKYPIQTLEDMSYFHFLSNQSIVFDFSGHSNFLFKEVSALGVKTVDYQMLIESWVESTALRIDEIASKKG